MQAIKTDNEGNVSYLQVKEVSNLLVDEGSKVAASDFGLCILSSERLLMLPFTMTVAVQALSLSRDIRDKARERSVSWTDREEYINKMVGYDFHRNANTTTKFVLESSEENLLGLQTLLQSALSRAWCAFEILCKDVWINALNKCPIQLAVSVWKNKKQGSDWDGIDVDVLAKFGFDLSNNMGLILGQRTSFTGVDKIRAAYKSAFGSTAVVNIFDEPKLVKVEKMRHLFQHRAGIIDEKYQSSSGEACQVGELRELTVDEVDEYIKLIAGKGCKLLQETDAWIVAKSK